MSLGSLDIKGIVDKEINSITNDLKKSITSQINNVTNDLQGSITSQIMSTITQIEHTLTDLITGKFVSILAQIGDILKNAIVNPILALFTGIGDIFLQIFNIIQTIANKIGSLPSCMPFYMIDSFISFIIRMIKYIVPGFIFDFFTNLYNWTFGIIVNWVLNFIGWTAADQRCYAFNVDDEISQMNQDTQDIGITFTSSFGKLNFSSITI